MDHTAHQIYQAFRAVTGNCVALWAVVGHRAEVDSVFVSVCSSTLWRRHSGYLAQLMMAVVMWLWKKVLAAFVAGCIVVLVYEFVAPIYSQQSVGEAVRTPLGAQGVLTFTKVRKCAPVKGTVVAFAYFGNFREPVQLLNSRGVPIVLRNFPPSKTPVKATLIWELSPNRPNPTSVGVTFDMRCITPIVQEGKLGPHPFIAVPTDK